MLLTNRSKQNFIATTNRVQTENWNLTSMKQTNFSKINSKYHRKWYKLNDLNGAEIQINSNEPSKFSYVHINTVCVFFYSQFTGFETILYRKKNQQHFRRIKWREKKTPMRCVDSSKVTPCESRYRTMEREQLRNELDGLLDVEWVRSTTH